MKNEKKVYSLKFYAQVAMKDEVVATSEKEAIDKLKERISSYGTNYQQCNTRYVAFCESKWIDYAEVDTDEIEVQEEPLCDVEDEYYEECA